MFIIGIIIIGLFGAMLHFTYEWSHHNKVVAVFSAVNESTWEHIKIAMTPTILWGIYEIIEYGFNGNFLVAKALCLLTLIVVIPILFYSYVVFTKRAILIVDIICFFIAITCSQFVFKYIIEMNLIDNIYVYLSIGLLIIEMILYFVLSFRPLKNFIFKDPITSKYGLEGHPCHHDHKHEH